MSRALRVLLWVCAALCAPSGLAQDASPSIFSFSGFGTLGVTHSSEEDADFVGNPLHATGAGYTHRWAFDTDSRLGAQVYANFTPQLSAVVQVISEQRPDDTFEPFVEWANLRYEVIPGFSIRVGRIIQPSFMASEYRKVGYAMPWVRPPPLYNMNPTTNSDGVDIRYEHDFGAWANTFQAVAGYHKTDVPGDSTVEAKQILGFANAIDYGNFRFRISYQQSKIYFDAFDPLLSGMALFGPPGQALADRYKVDGTKTRFYALGASYDPGAWFLMAEWARLKGESFIGDHVGWYLSGGVRIGKFTPYLTYTQLNSLHRTQDPGLAIPGAEALNAGINQLLATTNKDQKTFSIGVRWDFAEKAALKLQFDHSRNGDDAIGTLQNPQPGFQPGGDYNVFSATIDFLF